MYSIKLLVNNKFIYLFFQLSMAIYPADKYVFIKTDMRVYCHKSN